MRTFPAAFTSEKNRKTGAAPVWIVRCPFATSTLYLSDIVFSVSSWMGGITTRSWVKSWGAIDEDISGSLSLTKVSDFSLQVIIDPDRSPNMEEILENAANNIETTDIGLYLWFLGLDPVTNPPQLMWEGNIVDYKLLDELTCQLDLVDHGVKLDRYVGTLLDTDLSTPAWIWKTWGKMAPIIMGDVDNVPCPLHLRGRSHRPYPGHHRRIPGQRGLTHRERRVTFPRVRHLQGKGRG